MKITVFYDYICPFCYLTATRLHALSREFDLEIDWKGVEIHPEFPSEGKNLSRSVKSLNRRQIVKDTALEEGEKVKLPGFVTNSRLSLEASEYAKTKGRFNEFHEGIYNAYFNERRNIGDINAILEVGEKSSLERDGLEECLKKRTMYDRIEKNKKDAERNHVLGVPTLFLESFPVHGNQSIETLRHLIRRTIERS